MRPRRTRFALVRTSCRRCGCELYTGSRSLFGADAAKGQLDRICEECITDEERLQIEAEVSAAAFARSAA